MPRKPRQLSPSELYHVILRGINKLAVFSSNEEKSYFLKVLHRMSKENEYEIHAYCLMDNHAHLLIKTGTLSLAESMKRICVSYVYYYNKIHNRTGPLFGNRFKSVIIDDETQLMVCARYIHRNPVKAGIVQKPESFFWSSYRYYLGLDQDSLVPIKTNTLLSIYHPVESHAIQELKSYTLSDEGEIPDGVTLLDSVIKIARFEDLKLEDIKTLARQRRDKIINKILDQSGAKAKDLSSILGLSTTVIYKAKQRCGQK